MATATKPKAQGMANMTGADDLPIEELIPDQPTRDDVFQAALWVARNTNRVPTLLGPTASGKTYGIHELAKQNNAEVVTVLLGQHTPDEVAGFQLAIDNKLVIQMPYWFRHAQDVLDSGKSVYLLFDELGLSREETRGALYTFFRDRHLHGNALTLSGNAEVLVFAATNPGVFAPPFRSRCLFLHVPADRTYLHEMISNRLGNSAFTKKIVGMAKLTLDSDPAYSNQPPPVPETLDASAVAVLNALNGDFWKLSEAARLLVLAGIVPAQTLSQVLKDSSLDASALARNWEELLRALRALPTDKKHSMTNNVVETLPRIEADARGEALMSILDAMYDDLYANDLHTYFSTPRSEEVVKSVSEINPEYLERRLRERNLIMVDQDAKGQNKVSGTLVDRIQQMVKNTANEK
jgi:MoxR-like ATPase